jgi:hypothetical protein
MRGSETEGLLPHWMRMDVIIYVPHTGKPWVTNNHSERDTHLREQKKQKGPPLTPRDRVQVPPVLV